MRLIVSLGLFVLILSNISARELRGERRYRKYGIYPPKDKRGTDYSTNHGPKSYFAPIHGPIGGRSISGSSPNGINSGHSHLQNLEQLSLRHNSNPSSLSSSSFGQLGSNHGFSLASLGLGGHSGAQSGYSFPYFSQALSKNGPVTFGLHGGSPPINSASSYMSPMYATGAQGLSAFGSGGSSHDLNIPVMSWGSSGSPYSLQDSSDASHTVSGGFTIGSPHGSLPPSSSSSSSYPSASSSLSSYSSPSSSSSYPSASSSLSSYSSPPSSSSSSSYSSPNSYSSSANYHVGLSSGSSDSSSYQLPISSASYPVESGSYNSGYQPASSEGSTYASSGGSGYSFPSASYGNPSSAYSSSAHSGSSYSRPTVTYSQPGSTSYMQSGIGGYDNQSPNYSGSSMSYASPISGYSNTVEYDPSQQQSSSSYETAPEQQGSYSQINPMYLAYATPKSYDTSEMMQPKYDTISYSSPNGKY